MPYSSRIATELRHQADALERGHAGTRSAIATSLRRFAEDLEAPPRTMAAPGLPDDAAQGRMWAMLELPCPLEHLGDKTRWRIVDGDPVALLEEIVPFIGWASPVCEELRAKAHAWLEQFTDQGETNG